MSAAIVEELGDDYVMRPVLEDEAALAKRKIVVGVAHGQQELARFKTIRSIYFAPLKNIFYQDSRKKEVLIRVKD